MNYAFKSPVGKAAVWKRYESLLEMLNVPQEEKYQEIYVDTRYGKTYVISMGDNDEIPVILLHGSSMNSAMWIKDILVLRKKCQVFAVDLPGEPGKSDERQLPFDTSDYTDWLSDALEKLGLIRAMIVGASLGAWLAVKFAVRYPEKAEMLVLLCPAGIRSQYHEFKDIAFSLIIQGEQGVNKLFRLIGGNAVPDAVINYHKLISSHFNARTEAIPLFSDEDLQRLSMPCKLFVGAKDAMLRSDETAERILRLVPHSEIEILPDKGHSLTGLNTKSRNL